MSDHPYRLNNLNTIAAVRVEGLGFPKDGIADVHFDDQGVPWCTKLKCRSARKGAVADIYCELKGSAVYDRPTNPLCYPAIANAMAPTQLRLRRAYDKGMQDGRQEVWDECSPDGCKKA